ncbi:MAG: YIP1 family protein [Dokdonella sp.]|uniref:Yip1 family protein n=1 Tax=Dokdonella sp. TaxID=2291710 RepID=UPI0025BAD6B4|nr:Yip1 family protein [Dokdonella sp.]MBZ0223465.1 YIP1 family protein [Dokdonella sp.]
MDINKIIGRVQNILLTPKTEWPVIANEPATVADLYKNYIAIVAAIPVIAGFIKGSLIGYGGWGFTARTPIGSGIVAAVIGYALSLGVVYLISLIVDALAPNFGGQKNPVQALKVTAYAWTASWIAGIGALVPWLGWLITLAGFAYAIYLMFIGLPETMKCPPEKSGGYTAVSIIIGIVLSWIVAIVVAGIAGTGAMMSGALNHSSFGDSSVTIDKDSALGKLDAWSKKVESAGKQMEAAQKSGDAEAQGKAMGAMMGAALGGGDAVEALAPDQLKPFVPETLGGLKRSSFSAERSGAMGLQVSTAEATYSDDAGKSLHLEVTDTGSAKGLMGIASWAAVQNDRETDHGYEKTYKQDGRLVHEEWNNQDKHGEFSIVLGNRFTVKVSGNADSIDQLKAALGSLNLAGLEALKSSGVKNG